MNVRHHECDTAFSKVFDSIQLCAYYALAYDEDFTNKQMVNFNKFLFQFNKQTTSEEICAERDHIKKYLGIDLSDWAKSFPMRIKLRMYGKKVKNPILIAQNLNDSVETFLVLAVIVLRRHYRFSAARIEHWWNATTEIAMNYGNKQAMNDMHIVEWFNKIVGLPVEMNGEVYGKKEVK